MFSNSASPRRGQAERVHDNREPEEDSMKKVTYEGKIKSPEPYERDFIDFVKLMRRTEAIGHVDLVSRRLFEGFEGKNVKITIEEQPPTCHYHGCDGKLDLAQIRINSTVSTPIMICPHGHWRHIGEGDEQ
jgi:hypothetical protein